jgi:1-acyl-sn-glycerol-3-phosphate acyltransferase
MIHTGYGLLVFSILFILMLPLLMIPILFPSRFRLVGIINRLWAKLLFILCFLPFKVEVRKKLDPARNYVFCPNHFSYLDIPTMGLNPHNAIFVGKNEMESIPLFGFMYRKLHITVDRSKLKSRFNTILRSLDALHEGKSLVIYPEGGIITKHPPELAPFKDGAFRAAIEKQVPIVPVTIPNNWVLLPDDQFILNWGVIHVVFHEPIETKGYTPNQVDLLKGIVRNVIETELAKQVLTKMVMST